KDSCFACYKTILDGFDVVHLLNFLHEDGNRSSHGLRAELLSIQSQAIGIPIVQGMTKRNTYEQEFKKIVSSLKQDDIQGIVFGDIYLQEHRDWIKRVCSEIDIRPIFPLWGMDTEKIVLDFIDSGFEAVIVAVKAEILGEEWLGQKVDKNLIEELKERKIDPCGESGEYHTFVVDGPLFKRRLKILEGDKVLKDRYWLLDISKYEIIDK
ncbi:MAG TPA: diphthine--ammonia ligase, partial [Methanocellales archaeon]|nr:diphthine--ammonia ligase [Methanocellales archaeon]